MPTLRRSAEKERIKAEKKKKKKRTKNHDVTVPQRVDSD